MFDTGHSVRDESGHSLRSCTCELTLFDTAGLAQKAVRDQDDPCKVKSRVVADATYCDRYWECVSGQPELYDCPNGLVYAGKHRGVTEGCDYPWRSNYCEGKQLASTITWFSLVVSATIRTAWMWRSLLYRHAHVYCTNSLLRS